MENPTTLRLPIEMIEAMRQLIDRGLFPSRSELIREGIREVFKKYADYLDERFRRYYADGGQKGNETARTALRHLYKALYLLNGLTDELLRGKITRKRALEMAEEARSHVQSAISLLGRLL